MRLVKRLLFAIPMTMLLVPAAASASTITFTLGTSDFSANPPATSGGATITITNDGQAANTVKVTIAANLTGTDTISDIWLNYNGSASDLAALQTSAPFSYQSGIQASSVTGNPYTADGGGLYDIHLSYSVANNVDNFDGTDKSVYLISLSGITPEKFNIKSEVSGGNGTYFAAAHIQSLSTGPQQSGFFGDSNSSDNETPTPVPEPSTLLLLGSALGVGARKLRRAKLAA